MHIVNQYHIKGPVCPVGFMPKKKNLALGATPTAQLNPVTGSPGWYPPSELGIQPRYEPLKSIHDSQRGQGVFHGRTLAELPSELFAKTRCLAEMSWCGTFRSIRGNRPMANLSPWDNCSATRLPCGKKQVRVFSDWYHLISMIVKSFLCSAICRDLEFVGVFCAPVVVGAPVARGALASHTQPR